MQTVTSQDGTKIAFDKVGSGPAVILVNGAMAYRAFVPSMAQLAELLGKHFTVYNYDRRGRGDSGDTRPFAREREIEDLQALVEDAGGKAMVFGISSGGVVSLDAAAVTPGITKVGVYEPALIVNIRLPPEGLNESQLQSFITHNILSDEIPFYLATYLVVASSWISHYRIITYLKHSNSLFLILNVLFLASIVFLPVPVAFFYQYGNQLGSLLVFACTQLVTSLALLLMWGVARVDHLLDPATSPQYRRYTTARLFVIPIGTLFAIAVAYYNVWLAEGILLFFYVLGWFLRGLFYRHHQRADSLEGTVRMCSITDNMTAVAITFLITTITGVLLSNKGQSFSAALNEVLAELPVYGFSLLIVGFFWLSHHRIFMVIRRHTMTLIWLNFAFLLCIEFQPIFNNLHASYPSSQTATVLYASEQAATGLMLLVIWWSAAKGHRLIDKTMERFEIMFFAFRALLVPIIFILSIAIILFRNNIVIYFWLLVIVVEVVDLISRRIRRISREEDRLPDEADV